MQNTNYEIACKVGDFQPASKASLEEIKKLITDVTELKDVFDEKQYEMLIIHLNDQKRLKEKQLEKEKKRKEKKKEYNEKTYERRLNNKSFCECCDLEIDKYCMKSHNQTVNHKKNAYVFKFHEE